VNTRRSIIEHRLTGVDGHAPKERIAKHVKMTQDPFVFFRGSSQLFYADIKSGLLAFPEAFSSVPNTSIMGDCHISNFGFLTEEGSHGDHVIFAPNDFDDACIGPAVWDVSRFIVSLKLAAEFGKKIASGEIFVKDKFVNKKTLSKDTILQAINAFITSYQTTCEHSIDDPKVLHMAISSFDDEHILAKPYNKALQRGAGGNSFTTESRLAKAVDWSNTHIKFKTLADKFNPVEATLKQEIIHTFAPYVDDHIWDVTERLGSGTGSLNMGRYYLLVGPKDFSGDADLPLCHIIEVKQQRQAAPLYHFLDLSPVNRLNPAHLTVQCQRRMQRNPDLVLDEVNWREHFWLVRSRHHAKVGINPENVVLGKKATKGGFVQYAETCGVALALAHCRGDKRSARFEQAMCKALSSNKEELISACLLYAEQVTEDTEHLTQLIAE
jgi:uncharacterized protein (DUF2252 family)